MPRSNDLPDVLKSLTRRNAIEISHKRFSTDIERLIRVLSQIFDQLDTEQVVERTKSKQHTAKQVAHGSTQSENKELDFGENTLATLKPQQTTYTPKRKFSFQHNIDIFFNFYAFLTHRPILLLPMPSPWSRIQTGMIGISST